MQCHQNTSKYFVLLAFFNIFLLILYETFTKIMEELLACRACLATGGKLFNMYKYDLVSSYEMVTGIQMNSSDSLPHQLCSYCLVQLQKSSMFQQKCRNAQEILHYAFLHGHLLTTDYIRSIDRDTNNLILPYTIQNTSHIIKLEQSDRHDSNINIDNTVDEIDRSYDCDVKNDGTDNKNVIKLEQDDFDNNSDEIPLSNMMKKSKKRKRKNKNSIDLESIRIKDENNINDISDVSIEFDNFDSLIDDDNFEKSGDIQLIVLTKEQQIEEVLNRKNSLNYKNSAYKCDKCFKGFMTDVTYRNHMARHDPSFGGFECDVCLVRWPDGRALRAHQLATHAKHYVCKLCQHVARSSHSARAHIKWHEGFTYICDICGATFDKSTSRLTHIRLQHPSTHACDVCGESFVGDNGLRLHKKKAHRDNCEIKKETKCLMCGTQFRTVSALERHVAARGEACNGGARPCVHCGDSFRSEELLKEHARCHQKDDTVKCIECDRTFAHARSYAIHHQRVHLGVKSAQRRKTSSSQGDSAVCELCGKTCISRATLVYHQRTHTGEKPYQCTECPKKFSIYQRLQIHTRTHTGERPFKCSHCPKGFKHKAALNRHVRVHTGAKPYACVHCSKAFSQSNSLKTHIATVHLKLPAPYRKSGRKDEYHE